MRLGMSRARLVITAVVVEGRTQTEVARTYGVSQGWVSRLVARYRAEGDAAFESRSRRPRDSPAATRREIVERIVELRRDLVNRGLDAGPKTIAWHLAQFQKLEVATATISRILVREGLVTPQPQLTWPCAFKWSIFGTSRLAGQLILGTSPQVSDGGDDGTRTHDPLLAKMLDPDRGEQ
jgi:transposase